IVPRGVFAGTSKPTFAAPGPTGPVAPWGPCGPTGPAGPAGPWAPRAPRTTGTTEGGSFAFLPSGTSFPGFGVRDALMPFTAPAFGANAATERLTAPPAGDAASATSRSAAPPSTAMSRVVRTSDLLESETSGLLNYRAQQLRGAHWGDFVTVSARSCR